MTSGKFPKYLKAMARIKQRQENGVAGSEAGAVMPSGAVKPSDTVRPSDTVKPCSAAERKEQAEPEAVLEPCCQGNVHIAYRGVSDDRMYISYGRAFHELRFFRPNGLRVFCADCRRRMV